MVSSHDDGDGPSARALAAGLRMPGQHACAPHSASLPLFPAPRLHLHPRPRAASAGAASAPSSDAALASASALGHTGEWRDQLGAFFCSRPEFPDGPNCTHHDPDTHEPCTAEAGIIEVPHWSCCGERLYGATCTLPRQLHRAEEKRAQREKAAAAAAAARAAAEAAAGGAAATGGAATATSSPAPAPAAAAAAAGAASGGAGLPRAGSKAAWTPSVGAKVTLAGGVPVDDCLPARDSVGSVVSVSQWADGRVTADVRGPTGKHMPYPFHHLLPYAPPTAGTPATAAFESVVSILRAAPRAAVLAAFGSSA